MHITNENDDETILAELGRRLARTRLERNISQQGLATEAGVSKRTVERIEAGAGRDCRASSASSGCSASSTSSTGWCPSRCRARSSG